MTESSSAFIRQFSRTMQRWSLQLKKTESLLKSSNVNSCSANPITMKWGKNNEKNGNRAAWGQGAGQDIQTIATLLEDNHGSVNLGYSLAVKNNIATQTSRNGRANLPDSCPSWTPHSPPLLCHYCSKIPGVAPSSACRAVALPVETQPQKREPRDDVAEPLFPSPK